MKKHNDFDPWNDHEKEIIRRMNRRTTAILFLITAGSAIAFICKLILG